MKALLPIICSLLLLAQPMNAGCQSETLLPASVDSYRFSFPLDDGAHNAFACERWRMTGHVRTRSGHKFAYAATFFRYTSDGTGTAHHTSAWIRPNVYSAVFSIADDTLGKFVFDETFAREALGSGSASSSRLSIKVAKWSIQALKVVETGVSPIALNVVDNGNYFRLTSVPLKPPLINRVIYSPLCVRCGQHSYAYTRLKTTGSLGLFGKTYRVVGISWLDHVFSSQDVPDGTNGWSLLETQLNDGRDVEILDLRRADGSVVSIGATVDKSGKQTYFSSTTGHDLSKVFYWRSDRTASVYPDSWRFGLGAVGIEVTLTPTIYDQEINSARRGVSYWDGSVEAKDFANSGRTIGAGFVQLLGFGPDSTP